MNGIDSSFDAFEWKAQARKTSEKWNMKLKSFQVVAFDYYLLAIGLICGKLPFYRNTQIVHVRFVFASILIILQLNVFLIEFQS